MTDIFSPLTVAEIALCSRNHGLSFPRGCRTRAAIVEHIIFHGTDLLLLTLQQAAQQKQHQERPVRSVPSSSDQDFQHDIQKFLDLPSDDQLNSCYQHFYDSTGNGPVQPFICAICAGQFSPYEEPSIRLSLEDLPNRHRLHPRTTHPAHELTDGLLLERQGICVEEGTTVITLCRRCHKELLESIDDHPRHSLANDLWIGPVPFVIEQLSIPEQLLISLIFPRVYVFKLFPKSFSHSADLNSMQRAMRGTLSSYAIDQQGVADMVTGRLLPHPLTILPAVLSVTIISHSALPSSWLKSTFRVRRRCIYDALRWLKVNNTKYFGEIVIDEERLSSFPMDDVPDEVLSIVRQSSDVDIVDQESAGYVPMEDDDDGTPFVVPLHISGSVDVDQTSLSSSELMLWGLQNLWTQGREGGYIARHSRHPVSDFPDNSESNYFEKAFPALFPYGCGGLESIRAGRLSLHDHVKWCLRYHDRRFRRHETFPFVSFAIQQRRQALGSARIQMQRKDFERDAHILSTISVDSLQEASQQESEGQHITDPAIRTLRRHLIAAAGRVQGADQSRTRLRSQIWSTTLIHGPPSLWITINPSDLHDPIAQIFAGASIDLDNFVATSGPPKEQRAINIANDPYAASQFFHFMIRTVLESLFDIKIVQHTVCSGNGVLGHVDAYFGTVECQGRGTLHLHMLLWLANTPSPSEMEGLLKTETFRAKLVRYLKANFCAYVPGLESRDAVIAIPANSEISYNRPLSLSSSTYRSDSSAFELQLARALQVHSCKYRRCVFPDKDGKLVCKRRAPFTCSPEYYVNDDGTWGVQRHYGMVNTWVRHILMNCRCNNDGKFLTNAVDTRNITFYVTSYTAKKQGRNHNLSAVMTKGFAYHRDHERPDLASVKDQNRLLLFRLVNSINREQELAAPMVMSYLMDWGDVYTSHTYSPIYWSSFTFQLCKIYPTLSRRTIITNAGQNVPPSSDHSDIEHPSLQQDDGQLVTLEVDKGRMVCAKSQYADYTLRGTALSRFNVFDFFMSTYEVPLKANDHVSNHHHRTGRLRHERIPYLANHPRATSFQRVHRSANHRNLPNIVGQWFTRSDDADTYPLYCASMLMLFKPWRDLTSDLKTEGESWADAWTSFLSHTDRRTVMIVECIQYFHQCHSSSLQQNQPSTEDHPSFTTDRNDDSEDDFIDDEDLPVVTYSEEGLTDLLAATGSYREEHYGSDAVDSGRKAGVFMNNATAWNVASPSSLCQATDNDLLRIKQWRDQLHSDVLQLNTPVAFEDRVNGDATVLRLSDSSSSLPSVGHLHSNEEPLQPLPSSELNQHQKRAYDIVLWHLTQSSSSHSPPPLYMILYGEGGTGKSKVIQSITAAFRLLNMEERLVKAAYTGVAASLIEGKTTHTIGAMSATTQKSISADAQAKLQKFWRGKDYLIIDEFSMLSKTFLSVLSKNIAIGKADEQGEPSPNPFGGVNVILCGDLHQFPPVGRSKRDALFYPIQSQSDSFEMQIGRAIYEQFRTVVILTEQIRVIDPGWRDFLRHLRLGGITREDLAMLRGQLLTKHKEEDDFTAEPWKSAALVTPRHSVRVRWNEMMTEKTCRLSGQPLLVCSAEDTIKGQPLSLPEKYAVASRKKVTGLHGRKELPRTVELAIGMEVMVTNNVETDLDVTNGARGVVVDIILHQHEPSISSNHRIDLLHLPLCILVKLTRTRASQLQGLDPCVIPVEPTVSTMMINVEGIGGKQVRKTVKRRQFPITAAYAFTDYRAQGQTIPYVIVDIASPPSGALTLFNLYVALSRSRGRQSLRILRDFDDFPFMQTHDTALLTEDDRLEYLNIQTLEWWAKMSDVNALDEMPH